MKVINKDCTDNNELESTVKTLIGKVSGFYMVFTTFDENLFALYLSPNYWR